MEPIKVRSNIATLAGCGLAAGLLAWAAGARDSAPDRPPSPDLSHKRAITCDPYLDRPPPRRIHGLSLVKAPMNWVYRCTECHKSLPAKWHFDRPLAEHQHIQLRHGENRFCLNCHHATNRNAFADGS